MHWYSGPWTTSRFSFSVRSPIARNLFQSAIENNHRFWYQFFQSVNSRCTGTLYGTATQSVSVGFWIFTKLEAVTDPRTQHPRHHIRTQVYADPKLFLVFHAAQLEFEFYVITKFLITNTAGGFPWPVGLSFFHNFFFPRFPFVTP